MSPRARRTDGRRLTHRKRQDILDAALLEFDAGGFKATSMDQVAARANVSKRTVYNHFGSKDELFAAIRSELFCRIAGIEYQYDPEKSLQEQLAAIAAQQVDVLCSEAFVTFARISIPLSIRSTELARLTHREFHASNKAIRGWIRAAIADGRLDVPDPGFAARQILGLLNVGVLWPRLIGGQPAPSRSLRKRVIDSTVDMFLSCYEVSDG